MQNWKKTILKDVDDTELNARYLARRKDGLRKGGGFRLMCARM
ncbi:MAG TPA: hypothetical protein VF427_13240 [Noviherbaspirillum sp.]